MPPMKSVSSSALRAVLASSAFVKCYESEKIEREGEMCVWMCDMYIINIRVSIRIGPLHPPRIRGNNLFESDNTIRLRIYHYMYEYEYDFEAIFIRYFT